MYLRPKIVTLGRYVSTEAYVRSLEASGHKFSKWARDILKKVSCSQDKIDLELVIVSGADLGFTASATRREIFERAATFGLILCPAEVGLALREQYTDQPSGEWLLIAMEPITNSGDGVLYVFCVAHGSDGLWLRASGGRPGLQWHPDYLWMFLRRKP